MPTEIEIELKLKIDELNRYSNQRQLEYGVISSQLDLL